MSQWPIVFVRIENLAVLLFVLTSPSYFPFRRHVVVAQTGRDPIPSSSIPSVYSIDFGRLTYSTRDNVPRCFCVLFSDRKARNPDVAGGTGL